MGILCALIWRIRILGLNVHVIWCSTSLQPADPITLLDSDFHGVVVHVEQMAWFKWQQLNQCQEACCFLGIFTSALYF